MNEQVDDPVTWPWPDDLDGPIAAPDNHVTIFENERVRVLEITIRAGETAPLHTHRRATLLYALSGSQVVRRDETGAVLLDTRLADPPFELPRVQWAGPTPAHTLENPGSDDLLLIGVELKD
jgi:hypothetical protein